MKQISFDMHGRGEREHELYEMSPRGQDFWAAVTDVPCPVDGCDQTVIWYEAGYVPGYRVCMAPVAGHSNRFNMDTIKHRFLAVPPGWDVMDIHQPSLIRDDCCESVNDEEI